MNCKYPIITKAAAVPQVLTENTYINGPLCRVVLLVPGSAAVRTLVGGALYVLHGQGAICNTLTDVRRQPHTICAHTHKGKGKVRPETGHEDPLGRGR